MEVSIHELLAAAREAVKSDYIKGESILCETRYHPDTHYMKKIDKATDSMSNNAIDHWINLNVTNGVYTANCKVHCYKPEVREQIRQVMRFSGPRMLLYHPVLAVWHLVCSKKESKKETKG